MLFYWTNIVNPQTKFKNRANFFFITHGTTLIISGSNEFLFYQRASKRVQHKFTWMLFNEPDFISYAQKITGVTRKTFA